MTEKVTLGIVSSNKYLFRLKLKFNLKYFVILSYVFLPTIKFQLR